jgi:hypothetical protein
MGDDLRENWPSNMGERFAWGDRAQQRVHNWEREFNNQLAANRGDVGMATGMTNSLMGYEHREPTPANMAGHFQPDRQSLVLINQALLDNEALVVKQAVIVNQPLLIKQPLLGKEEILEIWKTPRQEVRHYLLVKEVNKNST